MSIIYNFISGFNHGTLLMRIGNSPWIVVGNRKSIISEYSGYITFVVNDKQTKDNQHPFRIQVNLFKPKI